MSEEFVNVPLKLLGLGWIGDLGNGDIKDLVPVYARASQAERAKDALNSLKSENFALAANQCHNGYGTEGGDHRCKYQDRIAELEKLLRGAECALRSYQHGNAAPALAEEIADVIGAALKGEK